MKKYSLIAFLLIVFSSFAFAQTGTWSGEIEVQSMRLTIVFHLNEEAPTMDVPDQAGIGIPIQVERQEGGMLSITIAAIGASYNGQLRDGQIVGTFSQMGASLPLTLSPGVRKLNRPQKPMPPFPYTQEEVTFTNGDAVLKGTLTLPKGCSNQTLALVMVSGSGLQNRDSELFEHKPFEVIADALARAGYATLRYDDRGCGESIGDVANATTDDFKADALAAIELLRGRFAKVGVIGHSEGGTIAMMLAAEGKVDFIVSLAGMVVSGEETLLWQTAIALSAAGVEQNDIDKYAQLLRETYSALRSGAPMPSAEGRELPIMLKQSYSGLSRQLQTPYIKRLITIDMRPLLDKISCPVLALNGTKDQQVEPESNLKALQDTLGGKNGSKVMAMEGLNHLFQHCSTGLVAEYRTLEETFAPEALEVIIKWLNSL